MSKAPAAPNMKPCASDFSSDLGVLVTSFATLWLKLKSGPAALQTGFPANWSPMDLRTATVLAAQFAPVVVATARTFLVALQLYVQTPRASDAAPT